MKKFTALFRDSMEEFKHVNTVTVMPGRSTEASGACRKRGSDHHKPDEAVS